MDLSQEQIEELEAALERLEALEPEALPEPARELAELLGRMLDELESN